MKICLIVPWFPSAKPTTKEARQGIFEYREAVKLSEKRHEFKIISIKWKGQLDYEVINNNIEVYRIPSIFIFTKIRYPVPNFIKLNDKIKRIYSNWQPDLIIYAHMGYLTTLPIFFLKNKINLPTVVTSDGLTGLTWFCNDKIVDFIGYIHSMFVAKKIFRLSDGIRFKCHIANKWLSKLNIDVDKVFEIARGVDTETFKPRDGKEFLRAELCIKEEDIVILYVGRLDLVKGVNYLLRAAKEIIPQHKNLKFLIVGDGSLREEYEAFSKSFSGNIIFTGFREDIPALMNISDIFVLPSLSEGAANVVMEASASCLPVIATKVGEVPKIVLNGKTGILVKPKDVNGLVNALKKLIDNPLLAKEMGEAGRKRMEEEYNWEMVCKKIENAYQEVINRYI